MTKNYRKIATIQAEQFDGSEEMQRKYRITKPINDHAKLMALEGNMDIYVGDWIATGVLGEHWAIADEVFQATYEEDSNDEP